MMSNPNIEGCELGKDLKKEFQDFQRRVSNIELKLVERLVIVETKLTNINGTLKVVSGLLGSLFVSVLVVIITLFLK